MTFMPGKRSEAKCMAHGTMDCPHCMAKGGQMTSPGMSDPMEEDSQAHPDAAGGHDFVSKVMAHMAKGGKVKMLYSEGGRVANDTSPEADFEDADYDDMEKDDDLDFHYTGADSGDDDGDEMEDDDRHDMVSQIMKSRKKKDRMPRPA